MKRSTARAFFSIILLMALALIALSPVFSADWEPMNEKIQEAGGPRGSRAMAVDPATGTIFLTNKTDVWVGEEQGAKWRRIDNGKIAGNLWFGLSLLHDSESGGLAVFKKDPPEDPVQSALTTDMGKTWQPMTRVTEGEDKLRSYGWSWGDVYWDDKKPRRILARMHHSQRIWLSTDGGQDWKELKVQTSYFGFAPDGSVLMAEYGGDELMRSVDDGETFETVYDSVDVTAHLPVRKNGKVYWVVKDRVIVSEDNGQSWERLEGNLKDAYCGPYFGETEKDMIVVTLDSVMRSRDGGKTWKAVAHNRSHEMEKAESEAKGKEDFRFDWFIGRTTWGWDAKNDIFYMARGPIEKIDLSDSKKE